ncbi:anticodon-binding domain-containing protein [Fimicolochytrium jonesii]|uniref:anticodon-binding domain-containing protein n=1 Tax=Fimicolochytrium jonesii TaxID=1396493 RepID=UPI0022FF3399|nr:anticodon-binding domain-containing protein [Fimicolochytrium jonesii]KAI8824937.1 anticodon-binding domain-containing protein [Fimicolochytrium jonesii]
MTSRQDENEASNTTSEVSPGDNNFGLDPATAEGLYVRLITTNDQTYEGLIYAYDTDWGVLVLQSSSGGGGAETSIPGLTESASATASASANDSGTSTPGSAATSNSPSPTPSVSAPGTFDFHMLKFSLIKDIEPVSGDGSDESASNSRIKGQKVPNPLPALAPFGPINMDKLAAREEAAIARIGFGVTPEAQTIFDHLSKTLPTRWRKTSIVIMDEIEINSPYNSADCKVVQGKTNAEASLSRVKKVLEGVRTRLGLDHNRQTQPHSAQNRR